MTCFHQQTQHHLLGISTFLSYCYCEKCSSRGVIPLFFFPSIFINIVPLANSRLARMTKVFQCVERKSLTQSVALVCSCPSWHLNVISNFTSSPWWANVLYSLTRCISLRCSKHFTWLHPLTLSPEKQSWAVIYMLNCRRTMEKKYHS